MYSNTGFALTDSFPKAMQIYFLALNCSFNFLILPHEFLTGVNIYFCKGLSKHSAHYSKCRIIHNMQGEFILRLVICFR